MSEADGRQTAGDVLEGCRGADECHTLLLFLNGQLEVSDLGYEDVFYPLRHHHREGLALRLTHGETVVHELEWGSGDFIYEVDDPDKNFRSAIDPYSRYEEVQAGQYGLDVVVIDAAREEGDHA